MDIIAKHKSEILAVVLILSLYFFLRLVNLTNLPIFTDEAIYIRWSQIGLQDPNWRFISLSDGKQPLFTWAVMVMLRFFEDPLFAGRAVSVVGGFFSLIAIWLVTFELFRKKSIAYLSSLTYVVFPFSQVADRMALYDSLSGAFTLWSLYFSILVVRKLRLDLALILGVSIGFGVLNKSTNFFSLYLLPFTLLLFDFSKKEVAKRFIKWILFSAAALVISFGMYSVLRLSGLFHMIELKNALFIYPFSEWIGHPFDFFIGNLKGMTNWAFEYLTLPFVALIIFSFRDRKFLKEKALLLLFALLPFIALALFARILFPRFIFFMMLSLLPLVSYGLYDLSEILSKKVKSISKNKARSFTLIAMIIFFFSYPLFITLQFAFDPINSRIAKPDNAQYVNHWTAGWGVRESVEFLRQSNENIFVATEGTFGLLPFALEIYLNKYPNITIKGYWPLENELPQEILKEAAKRKTYIVFYQPNNVNPPNPEKLKLITKYRAGNSIYYYRLYEVLPQE